MCLFIQALKTLMWMSPGLDLDGIVGVSCTGEAMLSCCPRRVTAIMLAPGVTGPKQIYIDLFARAGFRIISLPLRLKKLKEWVCIGLPIIENIIF